MSNMSNDQDKFVFCQQLGDKQEEENRGKRRGKDAQEETFYHSS